MRPDLKARLGEGCLLWLQLAIIGLVHGLPLLGVRPPLFERTALWHLQQSPGVSALLAGFTALMLLALWLIPTGAHRARLALAAVLVLAGLAGGLLFSPSLVYTYVFSARFVVGARIQDGRFAAGPNNPRISLGWLLVPVGVAVLLTWILTRLYLGAKWASSPASVFLVLLALLLFASAGLAVWRFSRRAPHG
jgi:hypothetical protein